MLRTPTFHSAVRRHVLQFAFMLSLPFMAKADLGITVLTEQNGNDITADFVVQNFNDILSMQFAVQWDPSVMQYSAIENYFPLPGMATNVNFGLTLTDVGVIMHSWYDPNVQGVNIDDCTTIFRVKFTSLNGQISPIQVGSHLYMPVEIMDGNSNPLNLVQGVACNDLGRISGKIYRDANENCQQDQGEEGLPNCSVMFKRDGQLQFIDANDQGEYFFHCPPGEYKISAILPENILLQPCQPIVNLSLNANETAELLFGSNTTGGSTASAAHEVKANLGLSVTPNPVTVGQALRLTTDVPADLQIMDISGRSLRQLKQTAAGEFVPNLQSGVYFVKATAADGSIQVVKLVVY
ncbi:MAG: T9SS type A sorting domain-containing protein [Saprospiraceae bacterium]|nr:T9SS type A sorting domain-containing protein [Saprospiraceae bacterium]